MIWNLLLVLLTVAVAAMALVSIALMRQVGGILLQLNPARVGEVDSGPEVETFVDVPGVAPDTPAVVVFASPTCRLCEFLGPALPALERHYPNVAVVPIVLGDDPSAREEYARSLGHGARPDAIDLAKEWDVHGTPFAVGVDAEGRVRGSGVANSLDHLESLAEAVLMPFAAREEHDHAEEEEELRAADANGGRAAREHADAVS
jgi:hypothetical protein